ATKSQTRLNPDLGEKVVGENKESFALRSLSHYLTFHNTIITKKQLSKVSNLSQIFCTFSDEVANSPKS
ncbi:MAG: hypothetical protein FWD82_09280, partial [Defluviitaleaceae bacterium]|nr:hypothetical protein [Defluviitaleaceae bacterium]